MRGKSVHRIFWWAMYSGLATKLPSWSRIGKRLRVHCAVRFCDSVHKTANINSHARIGWTTRIGEHGGVGEDCVLRGEVSIGPHVTMGPGCYFLTGDHPVPPDYGAFRDMTATSRPIIVQEDAFIGARAIVLSGVTIGRGAVVGAGAVVAKDVAPGVVVVGNPARDIRRRAV